MVHYFSCWSQNSASHHFDFFFFFFVILRHVNLNERLYLSNGSIGVTLGLLNLLNLPNLESAPPKGQEILFAHNLWNVCWKSMSTYCLSHAESVYTNLARIRQTACSPFQNVLIIFFQLFLLLAQIFATDYHQHVMKVPEKMEESSTT